MEQKLALKGRYYIDKANEFFYQLWALQPR